MQWDFDILSEEFDIRVANVCFNVHDLQGTIQTPHSLISGVAWADAIFCWFAQREAFWAVALSRVFKRKVAVVVGGADVTTIPEMGYGTSLSKRKRFYSAYVLNKATMLLPYSKDAEKAALELANDPSKVSLIYLGVDVEKFHPGGPKKDRVITVSVISHSNLKRKGLETFVKSAAYLPHIEFILVGQFADDSIDYLRSIAPKNVRFTGLIPERELITCYQAAKGYVQVSAHEAFGVALAEAMACECVPVVTKRGAIPEVAGDAAIYVPYDDPEATARGIQQAMQSSVGRAARERIEKCFDLGKRKDALLNHINRLLT
ncbi:MAG: glycosyltransferase family 4 protein [Halobacteriota archaeon]